VRAAEKNLLRLVVIADRPAKRCFSVGGQAFSQRDWEPVGVGKVITQDCAGKRFP